jgi:hypothetical protein
MQTLCEFPLERYISFLENQFTIYNELDWCTDALKKHITITTNVDYKFCESIKKFYEQKMIAFRQEGYITDFGVHFPALGIFRVWFRDSSWSEEVEWITLKVY